MGEQARPGGADVGAQAGLSEASTGGCGGEGRSGHGRAGGAAGGPGRASVGTSRPPSL